MRCRITDCVSCPTDLTKQLNFTSKNRAASPDSKAGQLHAGLGALVMLQFGLEISRVIFYKYFST